MFKKGYKMSEEHKRKISIALKNRIPKFIPNNLGIKRSEETRLKMSLAKKGTISPRKGIRLSEETKEKLRKANIGKKFTDLTRKRMSESAKKLVIEGKHHLWNGGISSVNRIIRGSLEYRLWRESVFKRDKYTCIWCKKHGIYLHADHIKPFCNYPELRFAIDNGRTLCVNCHKTTDTFGIKAKTK